MARTFGNGGNFGNNNSTNNGGDESWKADAFLNFRLPNGGDGTSKVGTIKLYKSKARDAQLIEFLTKNPDAAGALVAKMVVDFQLAEVGEDALFDLNDLL